MYDAQGQRLWAAELDIYGNLRTHSGNRSLCPFRYPGQYEDLETGLHYNRFRYYDPQAGEYISQDPIGLAGGNPTLYGYVGDVNTQIDPLGLSCGPTHKAPHSQLSSRQRKELQRKVRNRTATKSEYRQLDWDRRFSNRRKRGVARFWSEERSKIRTGNPGSRNWSASQKEEILKGKVPTHNGNPMEGHHMKNASDHPHLADDPSNITPVTEAEHIGKWHGGNFQNDTFGESLNPSFPNEF